MNDHSFRYEVKEKHHESDERALKLVSVKKQSPGWTGTDAKCQYRSRHPIRGDGKTVNRC